MDLLQAVQSLITNPRILTLAGLLCLITRIVYLVAFHPLSKFNGPLLWRSSRFPFVGALIRGSLPHRIRGIHHKYGSIVRVAPDEVSFTDPAAWRDIHAGNFARAPQYSNKPPGKDAENLISANESDHTRFRKVLAPAFAEKSMNDWEKAIQGHVTQLVQRLRLQAQNTDSSHPVNILQWYNYISLDIIGDFLWSSSFGCIDHERTPSWMRPMNQFKITMVRVVFKYYPPMDSFLRTITPKAAVAPLMNIWRTIEQMLDQRFSKQVSHPSDIIAHITSANEASSSHYMSRSEIEINSLSLIVAGSESVTTVLTGVTNYLLRNPTKLQILIKEIRSSYEDEKDITNTSLSRLSYLGAVLREGLRLCPTIPDGMRRTIPKGGATVADHYLPEGITVSIPQWATYQSSDNFHAPSTFLPERWLSSPTTAATASPKESPPREYALDRKDAFNPFSLGSRNCPGRSLAYMEMRFILARLLWNFDLEIPTGVELPNWETQEIYWFWVKKPLHVHLKQTQH